MSPDSLPSQHTAWRAAVFFTAVALLAAAGSWLMFDFLDRLPGEWEFSHGLLLGLFIVLFGYLAFGFCHAFFGLLVRRFGLSGGGLKPPKPEDHLPSGSSRTAIIIPVYNEPVDRVFAGIGAIYDSVMREERGDDFNIFILSDSNQADQWIAEEAAWMALCESRGAQDRIFYRRRPANTGKKSGNVSDFCRTWGDHYDFMIELDADSVMTGPTLVELVHRMEAHPGVGLIQTAPALAGAVSFFGRMQQFANRLYGPLFMEGLAFWQQGGGNFWGHNAIIRLKPFIEQCDLPELPGRKPFGGHILSHDFVEAGLLRRAGWEVWIAHDLEGSYEEGPQALVESAVRDRRWCQGNLQHSLLVLARGLRGLTRIHLINGILGYLSSPLWLAFMLTSLWVTFHTEGGETELYAEGLAIFGFTMVLLFLPKILCLIDLACDRPRARQYGGRSNAMTGALMETFFSALIAPVNMMFHTRFVLCNLLGITVGWNAQNRSANGTSWDEAIAAHGLHTLAGVGLATLGALAGGWTGFWWISPVAIGLIFSIPVSVWLSRPDFGKAARQERLFLTPEEKSPPTELVEALNPPARSVTTPMLASAVLDPFLNAVHVSLLRRNRRRLLTGKSVHGETAAKAAPTLNQDAQWKPLAERLLREGPDILDASETMSLLSDIDIMLWLHRQAWMRPTSELAPWWQRALRQLPAGV